jgi:hypothetical protein
MPHTCNYFDDPDHDGDGGQSGPLRPGRAAACCTGGACGENSPAAAGIGGVYRHTTTKMRNRLRRSLQHRWTQQAAA